MKNPITTKDLQVINELILFEQWSATKFRHYYDEISDKEIQKVMKDACKTHMARHEILFDYLKKNAKAGGEK